MRKLRTFLSHVSVIFAGVFITLAILHRYNPNMGFLTSGISTVYIILFCLTVVVLAITTIADNRHYARHMRQRAEEAARWKKINAASQRPSHRDDT